MCAKSMRYNRRAYAPRTRAKLSRRPPTADRRPRERDHVVRRVTYAEPKQQFVGWYTLGFGAHGSYRQSPCEWRDRDDRDRRRFGEREIDPSGRARIARCHSAPEHISAAIRRSAKGARPGPPARLCWYGLGHCQERG